MIGREDYPILEERTRCAVCGSRYRIREEDGTLQLQCEGCDASVIRWDELAEAVAAVVTIMDLYLDFLWEAIAWVEIDGYRLTVTMEEISGERMSNYLRAQDYWLARHSVMGDERAREAIYLQHEPLVKTRLRILHRKSPMKKQDVEDLEQAIWERLFRCLSNYNGRYRMWSWMKMLIRTENYRMYIRSNKDMISEDAVRVRSQVKAVQKESNIDRWMGNQHVSQLLSILTERERYVVIQYFFNGRTQKDLAVELNVCYQMANRIYQNALRKMREYELSERESVK